MRSKLHVVCMLTVALGVFTSSGLVAAEVTAVKKEKADVTKQVLKVSPDGKALVDQNGKEVARFSEGMEVTVPAADSKMPGCMCCTNDCIIYEGNRCVKRVRSCTWNFDCNCN